MREGTKKELVASCIATLGKTTADIIARETGLPQKLVTDLLWSLENDELVQSFRKKKPFQKTVYRPRVKLLEMYGMRKAA